MLIPINAAPPRSIRCRSKCEERSLLVYLDLMLESTMHKSRVTFCGINALHESSRTMYILNEKTWSVGDLLRHLSVTAPVAAMFQPRTNKQWFLYLPQGKFTSESVKVMNTIHTWLATTWSFSGATTAQMLPINICGWLNVSLFYNKRPLSGAAAEPSRTDTHLFFFFFFFFTHASFISEFKRRAAVFACFIPFGWEHVQRAVMWVAVMWFWYREYDLLTAGWWAAAFFFSKNISNGQLSLKCPELHSSTWMHRGHIAEDFAV